MKNTLCPKSFRQFIILPFFLSNFEITLNGCLLSNNFAESNAIINKNKEICCLKKHQILSTLLNLFPFQLYLHRNLTRASSEPYVQLSYVYCMLHRNVISTCSFDVRVMKKTVLYNFPLS